MIRAFVALALPDPVRTEFMIIGHGLPVPRPVPVENLHLTLVFLGEITETVLEDVHIELGAIRAPAVPVRFGGLDLFGGAKPRVVYAAVAEDPGLVHLQAKVETAARRAGLSIPARRYVPHVTLANLPERGLDLDRLARSVVGRPGPVAPSFVAEEFCLFRSHLRSDGPIYEELAAYALQPLR